MAVGIVLESSSSTPSSLKNRPIVGDPEYTRATQGNQIARSTDVRPLLIGLHG
jgi:hypothetical protein